ncbi:MAG: hypothetical protein K0S44_1886 [Bacteroidetes bacterium]|jgi:hypothetical protein|nr:hypothetical protein [Bacteroidota bacterium]
MSIIDKEGLLFAALLSETTNWIDEVNKMTDLKTALFLIEETLIVYHHRSEGLELLTEAAPREEGYISLDKVALRNYRTVIKRAEKLKELIEARMKTKPISVTPQIEHVLFHLYLQKAKIKPLFDHHPKSKKEGFEEVAHEYGITANSFRNKYYKMVKDPERIQAKHIESISNVIERLKKNNFLTASLIAEDELKVAVSKS